MQPFYITNQYTTIQAQPISFYTPIAPIAYPAQFCFQQNLIDNYQIQNVQQLQSIQQAQFMQPQQIYPQQTQIHQLQQNQYLGFSDAVNYVSQKYQDNDVNVFSNNFQGEYDQMMSSKSSYTSSTYQEEKQEEQDPTLVFQNTKTLEINIKNEDQGTSSTLFSLNQIPIVNSPSSNNSPSNNSPQSNKSADLNIKSLSYIQDQCDNSNLKTLKFEQYESQQYDNEKISNTFPSLKSQSSTLTQKICISNRQRPYNNMDSETENRKIIQTYQKISKININKNIIKAFKKFMLEKDNQEIISSFGFESEQKVQCKLMKSFFESLNHNNHSVTKIIDHQIYGGIFEFFLTFYAEQWLQSSRVQDKEAHFVAIDFFKLCCSENKVKLSNFKYYSKRKQETDNNSPQKQSQSSSSNQICTEQQQSYQRDEMCSNDVENNFYYNDSDTHQGYKEENLN